MEILTKYTNRTKYGSYCRYVHICSHVIIHFHRWGREGDPKDERFWGLAFCSLYVIKGYVLPSRPLFKKKGGKKLLCKPIILFTSRCMYKEWGEENGNVRKCQMPAGFVHCISPAEMFSPGKRALGWGAVVVQGHTTGDFEQNQC